MFGINNDWYVVIRKARDTGKGTIIKKLETEAKAKDFLEFWKERYYTDDDHKNLNIWVIHKSEY
jgi:hypothetical protein